MATKQDPSVFAEPIVYVADLGLMAATLQSFALCDLLAFRELVDAQIVRKTKAERKTLEAAQDARSQREDSFYAQLEAKQGAKSTRKRGRKLKLAA